jgi:hypothetical protein
LTFHIVQPCGLAETGWDRDKYQFAFQTSMQSIGQARARNEIGASRRDEELDVEQ